MSDNTGTDLATRDAEQEAIRAIQAEQYDDTPLQTPILKIGQPLTREVRDEIADVGNFINTLSGEDLGDEVEFIVAFYNRGWFASDKDTNRAYVAFGATIPEHWGEFVGEEFVGTPFAEYPDAEPSFKERVNNNEIEWGSGPKVAVTHNYTGFVVVSPEEGTDNEPELQPVRLSLQRTNMPAVRKLNTIARTILRGKPTYDLVYQLSTKRKDYAKGTAYLLEVRTGRKTTPQEKEEAQSLALAVMGGRVTSNEGSDDEGGKSEVEEPKGALSV